MENWNKKLITAAKDGDLEAVKVSLQNAADIDYQDEESARTALMLASKCGQLGVTRLLLDNKCKKETAGAFGYTALMLAASEGHLDVTKLLLDSGCEKETTDDDGYTVLMLAASVGNRDMTQLLLDSGCKKETKSTFGYTALLLAAAYGRIDVTQLLVDSGFETETTNKDGRTALHLAARSGHLQVTKYFVERALISPFVRTHKGETPYELAASYPDKYQSNKNVLEYLQHAMTTDPFNIIPLMPRNIQEKPITESEIASELKLGINKALVNKYIKLLESGSEKKRDIRLVVVGDKGTGKTSLSYKLFGEKNEGVTSTNGIEIHTMRCKANADDGSWTKLKGNDKKTECHRRLRRQFEGLPNKVFLQVNEQTKEDLIHNTLYTSFDESVTVSQQPEIAQLQGITVKLTGMPAFKVKPPETIKQPNKQFEQAQEDFNAMRADKSNVDLEDKNEYATLFLWDFAGDEAFYHTHQTFLSPDAIYLVVTKLNEADDKEAQERFQLWMNSIHCYCRLDDQQNKPESNPTESNMTNNENNTRFEPPVVLVGSHKDKVVPSDGKEIDDACVHHIDSYVKTVSQDAQHHIRNEYFISNTVMSVNDDNVFQKIRQTILVLAQNMRTWNRDYPLKFIQLEKLLLEKKKEFPIISMEELKQISQTTPLPLDDGELLLFLKYNHEIRALVFFEDLPNYIILDTQWLADAFKCIVTADKFRLGPGRRLGSKAWTEFKDKGILRGTVLEYILEANKDIFKFKKEQNNYILNVMEKFDIIIRPNISDTDVTEETPRYYVPCIVQTRPELMHIYEMFKVAKNAKSAWLCFEFRFLPPNLINHLIASMCRKYEVAECADSLKNRKKIALFKGLAVFESKEEPAKLQKLIVMRVQNLIQIQVWEFAKSAQVGKGIYHHIAKFFDAEMNKIISSRFKMTNVYFKKKWACGISVTEPGCAMFLHDFCKKPITEYRCSSCIENHTYIDEWSEQEKGSAADRYEKKQGQRGLVLIVNFVFKGTTDERKGSEIDVIKLKDFFTKIGYEIVCAQEDMTKDTLQKCLKDVERSYLTENSKKYYSFISVIMSHGSEVGIKTKDNNTITVEEIKKIFKNKSDGQFNGKPKLLLIQACRGQQIQEMVAVPDGSKIKKQVAMRVEFYESQQRRSSIITRHQTEPAGSSEVTVVDAHGFLPKQTPIDADIIVQYATTQGCAAFRHIHEGSYFIKAFLSVAENKYRDEHIEEILTQVRNKLATDPEYAPHSREGKCQMAVLESTSTKKFYL